MKTLERLIRLHKTRVDEKRLFIAQIEDRLQRLQTEIQEYYDELSREGALRDGSLTAQLMYPDYERGIHYKILRAKRYYQEVEIQLEKERQKLSEAYAELKVLEITRQKRIDEMAIIQRKKEQGELDELGRKHDRPKKIDRYTKF